MTNKHRFGKTLFALAMMIGLMNAFATTAQADEWRDHESHERYERYDHEWHHRHHDVYNHPVFVEQQPVVYYYTSPMIVQAPEVDTAPSGINLTFQLN